MPRYYCDYCDTYLTHDSPSVRKQHNAGYKHKANVRTYYQQYEAELNQSLIDQKVKEHLGAFRPPVAPYPQLRPLMPGMPLPGQYPPGHPGYRPPLMPIPMPMPRPMPGAPGYLPGPPMQMQMPQMMPPPGTAPMPGQMNGFPQFIPGTSGIPSSGAPPPMFAPPPSYQGNPPPVASSGGDNGAPNNSEGPDADQ